MFIVERLMDECKQVTASVVPLSVLDQYGAVQGIWGRTVKRLSALD